MMGWLRGPGMGSPLYYFGGLILLVGALIYALMVARRAWEEAHEDLEPASLDELLEGLKQAKEEGELDDREFARVRAELEKHAPPDDPPSENHR